MAKLIIERASSFLMRTRPFRVIVDGQDIGEVKNGKTVEYEIPVGKHTLRTGISPLNGISPVRPFTAVENQTVHFVTRPHPLTIVFMIIVCSMSGFLGVAVSRGIIAAWFVLALIVAIFGFLGYKFSVTLKQK